MTRSLKMTGVVFVVVFALIITGCPSPLNDTSSDGSPVDKSTAEVTYDASRGQLVFIEEDGSETPVVFSKDGENDSPVELIDYAILDGDDTTGRFSGSNNRIRCIVLGRRSDGRSGVWVIYRHGGVVVLPNEDNIEDSALLELVEAEGSPYLGDGWVYEARAISSDGRIIIGQLSRPDGWKYLDDTAPAPELGVFWSLCEKENKLIISRARPILLMHEPVTGTATRNSWGQKQREWLEKVKEWLQAMFLDLAWNYLSDAEEFVNPQDVDGGVPAGNYVVSGPDKHGMDAWAWLTSKSVENIVDAPKIEPPVNTAPNPAVIPAFPPATPTFFPVPNFGTAAVGINYSSPADPDGDSVSMEVVSVYELNSDNSVKSEVTDKAFLDFLNLQFTANGFSPETLSINGLQGVYTTYWTWKRIGVVIRVKDEHDAISSTGMVVFRFVSNT